MKWNEIRGWLGLVQFVAGSVAGRKGRKFARRLDLYVGNVDTIEAIRDRWHRAEIDGTGLELTAEEVSYLRRVRDRVL